jgi:hypothetical protein
VVRLPIGLDFGDLRSGLVRADVEVRVLSIGFISFSGGWLGIGAVVFVSLMAFAGGSGRSLVISAVVGSMNTPFSLRHSSVFWLA